MLNMYRINIFLVVEKGCFSCSIFLSRLPYLLQSILGFTTSSKIQVKQLPMSSYSEEITVIRKSWS